MNQPQATSAELVHSFKWKPAVIEASRALASLFLTLKIIVFGTYT